MKKFFFTILLLSFTTVVTSLLAQEKTFIQRIALEAGGGYSLPLSPSSNNTSLGDYATFKSFNLGANFELTELVGLRFTYGNNSFEDTNNSTLGVTYHKFMAEGTFNIIQSIERIQNPFEIMLHGGAGLSFGKSKQSSGVDKMGTLQIGLMPQYYITHNLSIHADATYVVNLKQDNFYDGTAMPNGDDIGQYLMINLGVAYNF